MQWTWEPWKVTKEVDQKNTKENKIGKIREKTEKANMQPKEIVSQKLQTYLGVGKKNFPKTFKYEASPMET